MNEEGGLTRPHFGRNHQLPLAAATEAKGTAKGETLFYYLFMVVEHDHAAYFFMKLIMYGRWELSDESGRSGFSGDINPVPSSMRG